MKKKIKIVLYRTKAKFSIMAKAVPNHAEATGHILQNHNQINNLKIQITFTKNSLLLQSESPSRATKQQ